MRIILRLLILGQLGVVMIFHCLTFALVRRLVVGGEYLPSLADRLGNLGEAQVFSFEMLSYFCNIRQKYCASTTCGSTYD